MIPSIHARIALAALLLSSVPAHAGQLAIGEVVPLDPPPGYIFRPVYTPPVPHSRWEPTDTSFRQTFREPLYATPRGYVYRYVRGYTRVRMAAAPVVRKVAKAPKGGTCVTELGFGRYHGCP